VLAFGGRRNVGGLEGGGVEHVEDQDRRIGDGGPPRLGDDGGVRNVVGVHGLLQRVDHVLAVFRERVVAARTLVGRPAGVVHGQAAAQVDVLQGRAFLHQV